MTKLLCSFAQCEITPDLEKETVIQDGYGSRFTPAEEVRDPLYAKIACFKQEETTFAIVSMDICGMSEKRKNTLRAWIGGISGLKDEAFALCGTHTHAGPACGVLGYLPENEFYWDRVGKTVGFALKEALSHWEEATLSFGYGTPLNAMENRRKKEIADRRVPVLSFTKADGSLLGVIASASCHAVCIGTNRISADYPSVLTERADKDHPKAPFLFLQGRSGDVDPVGMAKEDEETVLRRLGEEYADSVYSALQTSAPLSSDLTLRAGLRAVTIPFGYPAKEERQAALSDALAKLNEFPPQTVKRRNAETKLVWNRRMEALEERGIAPEMRLDVQLLLLGKEIAFAFLPFETLTVTGNALEEILQRRGIREVFAIGHGNGSNGYLAPAAEAGEDTYETKIASRWYNLPLCTDKTEPALLRAFDTLAAELLKE